MTTIIIVEYISFYPSDAKRARNSVNCNILLPGALSIATSASRFARARLRGSGSSAGTQARRKAPPPPRTKSLKRFTVKHGRRALVNSQG